MIFFNSYHCWPQVPLLVQLLPPPCRVVRAPPSCNNPFAVKLATIADCVLAFSPRPKPAHNGAAQPDKGVASSALPIGTGLHCEVPSLLLVLLMRSPSPSYTSASSQRPSLGCQSSDVIASCRRWAAASHGDADGTFEAAAAAASADFDCPPLACDAEAGISPLERSARSSTASQAVASCIALRYAASAAVSVVSTALTVRVATVIAAQRCTQT